MILKLERQACEGDRICADLEAEEDAREAVERARICAEFDHEDAYREAVGKERQVLSVLGFDRILMLRNMLVKLQRVHGFVRNLIMMILTVRLWRKIVRLLSVLGFVRVLRLRKILVRHAMFSKPPRPPMQHRRCQRAVASVCLFS